MRMISSRIIPFLDVDSLVSGLAREALFLDNNNCFVLYLSDGMPSSNMNERIIRLEMREALIWLNETSQDEGSFWN
jgi:hypothetical protein